MFLLTLWNLKEHNLLPNRQGLSQSMGEIFLTFFSVIPTLKKAANATPRYYVNKNHAT